MERPTYICIINGRIMTAPTEEHVECFLRAAVRHGIDVPSVTVYTMDDDVRDHYMMNFREAP